MKDARSSATDKARIDDGASFGYCGWSMNIRKSGGKNGMADYIERAQAIKAAIDAVDDWDGGGNRFRAKIIKQAICEVPSADVRENVRGHWIQEKTDVYLKNGEKSGIPVYIDVCSICGSCGNRELDNFCPNCGARMVEDE